MMIYTNKAMLQPMIIVLSVFFMPIIIVLTIYCIVFSNFQGYIILACFIFLFIVCIIATIKEAYSQRNFIKINDSFFEIKFDNLSSNGQAIIVNYDDIVQIEYYKINSFISWLQLLLSYQSPKVAFITIRENENIITKAIGYFEKNDLIKICESKNIKLIIH